MSNHRIATILTGLLVSLLPPGLSLGGSAFAQSVPAYQMGTAQPNDLAKWVRNGQLRDAAGVAGDNNGVGVNPFAVTDYGQLGVCSNSAPSGKGYSALCLGHDSQGNGVLSLSSQAGEPPHVLKFLVDGIDQGGPSGGGGSDMVLTGSLVINRNSGPPPPLEGGTVAPLRVIAGDAETQAVVIDGFGGSGGATDALITRRANGTNASPLPLLANDVMGNLAWRGYGAAGYGLGSARLAGIATEDWTGTGRGSGILIQTTQPGATTPVTQALFGPGLTIGAPPAPSDGMQIGDLNISGHLMVVHATNLPPAPANTNPVMWGVGLGGTPGENPTVVVDGVGGTPGIILRRVNNIVISPTPVAAGDILGIIGVRGYYTGVSPLGTPTPGAYSDTGNAQVEFTALDNFTPSARGAKIDLRATPIGSATVRTEATIGPGLMVGAPGAPTGWPALGDVLAQRLSAGQLVLAKGGPLPAIGGNFGTLALTAGTTAGTCMLVAYAGTSTTPAILLDNIGSGC